MALLESLIGPITSILDKIIPDKEARARAQLELIKLEGSQEMELIETKYCKLGWQQCIGTSGTIKTIIALCQEKFQVKQSDNYSKYLYQRFQDLKIDEKFNLDTDYPKFVELAKTKPAKTSKL